MEDKIMERTPSYGELLSDKLKSTITDFSKVSSFERFILDDGYLYDSEEELRAGYDRLWKSRHDILLTAEEFDAERWSIHKAWGGERDDTAVLYSVLAALVKEKKLPPCEVYMYARHGWCRKKPEAVIAYEADHKKWLVNNCDTEVTESEAKVQICREWGFEVSRIQIIGTPYYDSTDWQFIRFDCGRTSWLWTNENLYQVYDD